MQKIKQYEHCCEFCGKKLERKRFGNRLEDFNVFRKRKYCDKECMRKAFLKQGKQHQTYFNAHTTARNINSLLLKVTSCEICGSQSNLDVHHKDGDYQNNNLKNLQVLCRSCHLKQHRKKKNCVICGKPMKALGFCEKHYRRFKKYGNPLISNHKKVTE